ncbi:MAG: hypothetical protein WC382_11350 [Methanoregulaceae archaeon]
MHLIVGVRAFHGASGAMHRTRHFHRITHLVTGTRSVRRSSAHGPASDSIVNHLILLRGRPLFEERVKRT